MSAVKNATYKGFTKTEQTYRTENVVNNNTAVYVLSLRNPNGAKTVSINYIFPISPSNLRKAATAMSSFYDVSGTPIENGVSRIVDQYGMAPPIYTLEGTTGWQRHSNDNFAYTGLESIKQAQLLLDMMALGNNQQMLSQQKTLYTLELYDYFAQEFWEVVPQGEQIIRQSESQPLLFHYRFRLLCVKNLGTPPQSSIPDPISQAFSTAASTVGRTVQAFSNMVTGTYQEIAGIV